MKKILFILAAGSLLLAGCKRSNTANSDIKAAIEGGATVIDVRTVAEFDTGHYPGAKNIPHTEIGNRLDEVGSKDQEILLYCASGNRSGQAEKILKQAGYEKVTNAGAFKDMPKP